MESSQRAKKKAANGVKPESPIHSVEYLTRVGHKTSINSIAPLLSPHHPSLKDPNIFFTNSEDRFIKMWDMRASPKPTKLFTSPLLTPETSNLLATTNQNLLTTGTSSSIISFDFSMEKPLTNTPTNTFHNNTLDDPEETEINHISFSPQNHSKIYFCDDAGTIGSVFTHDLSPACVMPVVHTNIPFCIVTCEVKLDKKGAKRQEVSYSGGFDSMLVCCSVDEGRVLSRTGTGELVGRCLDVVLPTPAMVYGISYGEKRGDLLLSLQTGHVVSVKSKKPTDIRFFLEGHGKRVKSSQYAVWDEVWCFFEGKFRIKL
jgi:hypothetical protein